LRTRLTVAVPATVLLLALPATAAASRGDRNDDGIPDGWERSHRLALVKGQDLRDADRDGLTNFVEWQARTNPRRTDSDRDGLPDGREDPDRDGLRNRVEGRTGHDPRDPDTDADGTEDGEEGAGRVLRVRAGMATIELADGSRVRGRVDDESALSCRTSDDWLDYIDDAEDDAVDEDGTLADDTGVVGDALGDLPALRSEPGDDETPSEDPAAPAQDADDGSDAEDPTTDAEDEAEAEADDRCDDDALRPGTWLHSSDVDTEDEAGPHVIALDLVVR